MTYYVKKSESLYDFGGNVKSDGFYREWICVIEPSNKDEYDETYVHYNEIYYKDYGWQDGDIRVISKPDDFESYKVTTPGFCHNADYVYLMNIKGIEPKKKRKKRVKIGSNIMNLVDTQMNDALSSIEKQLRKNYDKFKETIDTGSFRLDDLLFLFYKQGHMDSTPTGCEMSDEDFEKYCFLKYIEDCIKKPEMYTKDIINPNDWVRVTYPCPGHDCLAFPDRCEDVGGDGETCSMLLNMSKLCGAEEARNYVAQNDPTVLSRDEVQQLTEILKKLT